MTTTYNVCIFFWGTVDYLSVSLANCELYGYKKSIKGIKDVCNAPCTAAVMGSRPDLREFEYLL